MVMAMFQSCTVSLPEGSPCAIFLGTRVRTGAMSEMAESVVAAVNHANMDKWIVCSNKSVYF